MKRFYRTLFSSSIFGLCSVFVAPASASSLQLASDVWPPFTDRFSQPRVAIEIVSVALSRIGRDAEIEILDSWTVPEDIKAGKYNGSAAMWKSPEREAYLLYSKPYLESRLHLVGRKGTDVSALNLSELAGKRIALVKGYAYGDIVDSAVGIEVVYTKSSVESLKMVANGGADYTLLDDLLIQYAKNEQPEKVEALVDFGEEPLLIQPLHFVLSKRLADAGATLEAFDKAIRIMQADGSYNRILRLNSIAIDIDDDGVKELVLSDENLGVGAISSGYSIYSNTNTLPEKKRYSIRDTIYDDWNQVPDDYRSTDDVIPDTRMQGFNIFGGDF